MQCKYPGCEKEVNYKEFCSKKCYQAYSRNFREYKNKLYIINLHGAKCQICGYDKNLNVLEFHHSDPTKKEFALSERWRCNLDSLIVESKKCILVCPNCHREIHTHQNYEFWIQKVKEYMEEHSGNMFPKRIVWPPKEKVSELVWSKPIKEVAKELKVNADSLVKHCEKNDILRPPLGYWTRTTGRTVGNKSRYKTDNKCIVCGKLICDTATRCKSCTRTMLNGEKIQWPSDEQLAEMVWQKPRTTLAKELGVSDRAIGKRCKVRNIPQPPRGYWAKQKCLNIKS
jgi:hypothetical protein